MNLENLFVGLFSSVSVRTCAAAVAVLVMAMLFVLRRARHAEEEPVAPKTRPVSIETELQMDVKGRWKRHKQPFLYKS